MKKATFLALIASSAISASAQIGKGSIFAGLDLSYYGSKNDQSTTTNNTTTKENQYKSSYRYIGPSAQYFFAENLSVGLGFGLTSNHRTTEMPQSNIKENYDYKDRGTDINLFARKYLNCSETFNTFIGLQLDLGSSNGSTIHSTTVNNVETSVKTSYEYRNNTIGLNLGFAWFVTPKVMFQGSIGALNVNRFKNKYNISSDGKSYDENNGSNFNFSLWSGSYPFNLGFAYRLAGGN